MLNVPLPVEPLLIASPPPLEPVEVQVLSQVSQRSPSNRVNAGLGVNPFAWFDRLDRVEVLTPLLKPRLSPQATKRNEVCADAHEAATNKPHINRANER